MLIIGFTIIGIIKTDISFSFTIQESRLKKLPEIKNILAILIF